MSKSLLWLGSIVLLCLACKPLNKLESEASLAIEESNKTYVFPFDWVGMYQGNLMILDEKGDTTFVDMKLKIDYPNASGFYPWTITYDDTDIRSYGLEAVNPEKGHYRIDEFNSIKIDGYLRGNHYISRFSVMNSDLVIDYEKVNEGIEVHLYISSNNDYIESGGEIIGESTVPMVHSYTLNVFQSAFLKKGRALKR